MGELVAFPVVRTCFACTHLGFGRETASHCLLFDEPIHSELYSARNCNAYEPE